MKKLFSLILSKALIIGFGVNICSAQLLPSRITDPIPTKVKLMYEKGLDYLISSQSPDGTWKDSMGNEPAVLASAILAVLASGESLENKRISRFLSSTLDTLIDKQDPESGYFENSMYNHGFSTLALAECYGHVTDDRIALSLKKAVDLILTAQENNPKNGWRYSPDSLDADTTVTGCQIVALLAARNAGVNVPDEAIEMALAYMETCRTAQGSYGYTEASNGKVTLTAIALLSHYLAKKEPDEKTAKSLNYLKKRLTYKDQHYPFYFEYYMSQALFQADLEVWQTWNERNIRYLSLIQGTDGSWSGNHGKAYSTSAALLSLALNYRLMPIYERF